ncbi:MAG: hypothetical protein SF028_15775 [Candidatus Sumerlaeia bacterium]|nr:hypothetical protein [Candidatus Sumerlaeia bacterium]
MAPKSIVLFGAGPWPLEPGAAVTGPAIRARQFAEPLIAAGHRVRLVLLEAEARAGIAVAGAAGACAVPPERILDAAHTAGALERGADAVFGVGSVMPAAAAAALAEHLGLPCWVDFFGDPLAELHALQSSPGAPFDVPRRDQVWRLMRAGLARGDAFSTVSGPQRLALIAQLGLLGRLGADPGAAARVASIPCAVPDAWTEWAPAPPFPRALAQRGVAPEAPLVVFGGSWNVWLDPEATGSLLRRSLERDPQLVAVLAGIPTGDAGERVRGALLAAVGGQDRLVDLGTPASGVEEAVLAHAGASVLIDREVPEAYLGSRNRLLAQVRWGVRPVVSTLAEVERELVAADLAADATGQDAVAAVVRAARRDAGARDSDRRRGLAWLAGVAFTATMEPALRWLDAGAPRWPAPPASGLVDWWRSAEPATAGESLLERIKRRLR